MKNTQKGFIVPLLGVIIVLLVVGLVLFIFLKNSPNARNTDATHISTVETNVDGATSPDPSKPSSIVVVSPKSAEVIVPGKSYIIKWSSSNVGNQAIFIDLDTSITNPSSGEQNFKNVSPIAHGIQNTGNYLWTPEENLPSGKSYVIGIHTSDNIPTGNNVAGGFSSTFTINSKNPAPEAPVITSIFPATAFADNTSFGMGSTLTVKGTGFSEDTIHLVDANTGETVTDLAINTPTGNPTDSTTFKISIPNNSLPGKYAIVVEDNRFGFKSQPYPITIVSNTLSGFQNYDSVQDGFSFKYPLSSKIIHFTPNDWVTDALAVDGISPLSLFIAPVANLRGPYIVRNTVFSFDQIASLLTVSANSNAAFIDPSKIICAPVMLGENGDIYGASISSSYTRLGEGDLETHRQYFIIADNGFAFMFDVYYNSYNSTEIQQKADDIVKSFKLIPPVRSVKIGCGVSQ